MKNQANLYRNPNQFFKQFSLELSVSDMEEVTRTKNGELPSQYMFCIMRIEDIGKKIKFPVPVGRSTVYEICWLNEGSMIRTDGLVDYEIIRNNICLYRAGAIKGSKSLSKDAKGYYCLFDKDFILQFLKNQASLDELPFFLDNGWGLLQLTPKNNRSIRMLLDTLYKEYRNDLPERERLMGLMLCQLLITAKRFSSEVLNDENKTSGEILVKRFLEVVKVNVKKQRTVQFYANHLNVTANYINKCVKTYTGRPATYHITSMLILEAKIMLKQSNLSIAEIANELGFEDTSYFSRMFHKNTGITPRGYKKQGT